MLIIIIVTVSSVDLMWARIRKRFIQTMSIDQIVELNPRRSATPYGGEVMSQLEHALQRAALFSPLRSTCSSVRAAHSMRAPRRSSLCGPM